MELAVTTQLILYTDSDTPLDAIAATLEQAGFIATPFDFRGEQHYRTGEGFLQLITFLGCSPTFSLDISDEEGFCHIKLGHSSAPTFLGGGPHTMVRCPNCRETVRQALDTLQRDTLQWRCPKCGESVCADRIGWRRQAGLGTRWVAIWGVQPELAVPSQELLEALQQTTESRWHYCYLG